jgi:methionine aminopeptidase
MRIALQLEPLEPHSEMLEKIQWPRVLGGMLVTIEPMLEDGPIKSLMLKKMLKAMATKTKPLPEGGRTELRIVMVNTQSLAFWPEPIVLKIEEQLPQLEQKLKTFQKMHRLRDLGGKPGTIEQRPEEK